MFPHMRITIRIYYFPEFLIINIKIVKKFLIITSRKLSIISLDQAHTLFSCYMTITYLMRSIARRSGNTKLEEGKIEMKAIMPIIKTRIFRISPFRTTKVISLKGTMLDSKIVILLRYPFLVVREPVELYPFRFQRIRFGGFIESYIALIIIVFREVISILKTIFHQVACSDPLEILLIPHLERHAPEVIDAWITTILSFPIFSEENQFDIKSLCYMKCVGHLSITEALPSITHTLKTKTSEFPMKLPVLPVHQVLKTTNLNEVVEILESNICVLKWGKSDCQWMHPIRIFQIISNTRTVLSAAAGHDDIKTPIGAPIFIAEFLQLFLSHSPINFVCLDICETTSTTHTFFIEVNTRTLIRNNALSTEIYFLREQVKLPINYFYRHPINLSFYN